jgi:hypothetical protein
MLLDLAFDGYKKHMMDYHKVKEHNLSRLIIAQGLVMGARSKITKDLRCEPKSIINLYGILNKLGSSFFFYLPCLGRQGCCV